MFPLSQRLFSLAVLAMYISPSAAFVPAWFTPHAKQTNLFGSVVDLTNDNYADMMAGDKPQSLLLVDCCAQWCGPCKLLEPILATVAADHAADLLVCRYDVDASDNSSSSSSSSARNFKVELALQGCLVRALPALVLLDAATGQVLEHWEGLKSQQQIEEGLRPHYHRHNKIMTTTTKSTLSKDKEETTSNKGLIRMAKQEQDDYMLANAFM